MSRQSFFSLHALLQPHIEKRHTHLRPTIPSEHRLAVFLYHIAQGAEYTVVSNQFGIGRSTVSSIIGDVSKAITVHFAKRYIRFPNADEATRTMEFWRQKSEIPGIVACIDGSDIPITQPAHSAAAYCNRKGFYSMNVQGNIPAQCFCSLLLAAVDHKVHFVELTVGWPGSVADGRVFSNSFLKKNLEHLLGNLPPNPLRTRMSDTSPDTQVEHVPAFILGDSAYPNRTHVVTTSRNTDCNRSLDIKTLNAKLAKVRYSVEGAFGILKGRFRLLNRPLESAKEDIKRTAYLITAIFVVHNFLIDEYDDTHIEPVVEPRGVGVDDDFDEDDEGREQNREEEQPTRDVLLRHIYWRKNHNRR
jgi:DDE superfamily endonuclease